MASTKDTKVRGPAYPLGEPDYVQMTLSLSPDLYQAIRNLAKQENINKSDILLKALTLYMFLKQARADGKRVGVAAEGDKLETEITGL